MRINQNPPSDAQIPYLELHDGTQVIGGIDANGSPYGTVSIGGGGGTTPLAIGSGDLVNALASGVAGNSELKLGTAGSPYQTVGAVLRVDKTEQLTEAQMAAAATGGNGSTNDLNAGIVSAVINTATSEVQAVGFFGSAQTNSTQSAHNDDALGVWAGGRVLGSGTGYGIGGYLEGRRDTTTGHTNGVEVRSANFTATDGTYSAGGPSDTMGLWLTAGGTASKKSGVAIQVGNPFGNQWDVGIGFASANGGSVATTSIRDDSSSTNSILINGTHTVAIGIASTAGPVLIGGQTAFQSASKLEVQGSSSATADPLLLIGATSGGFTYTIWLRNGSAIAKLGVAGATNSLISGTVGGDLAIFNSTGSKSVHLGGTASVVQVTNGNALGFFSVATPVAKQTVTGAKGSNAALGSLMAALAAYGLVTDSTSA